MKGGACGQDVRAKSNRLFYFILSVTDLYFKAKMTNHGRPYSLFAFGL